MMRILSAFVLILALCSPAMANEGIKTHLGAVGVLSDVRKDVCTMVGKKPAWISSKFGMRVLRGKRGFHKGIDIAAVKGTPVKPLHEGVVLKAGWCGSFGYMVEIYHGLGVTTRYAHLSGVDVRPLNYVKKGQTIGRVGSTGRSTGNHLHFELRIRGEAVDPMILHKTRRFAAR